MEPEKSPPSPSVNRRGFFRQLLLRGLEQAENTEQSLRRRVQAGLSAMTVLENRLARPKEVPPPHQAPETVYLRPPGALPEPVFATMCSRCGKCVEACPAQCIRIEEGVASGLPHIVARESPCVICTDLSCMKVCPTGALQLVDRATDIRMGTAVVNFDRCLRTAPHTQPGDRECRVCVNQCPIGETALAIDPEGRLTVGSGCTGCGVCEWSCPTEPASIMVVPQNGHL